MREHLLGYLLEALEPHEAESVRQSLDNDEQLRRELEILRRCLMPLSADAAAFDPPVGLAQRTCNYVAAQVETTLVRVPARTSRWSFADMLAATVLVAASAIFFPAIQQSRHNAQITACSNNLRQHGTALAQLGQANGGWIMPAAQINDPKQAVAGIVAVDLREKNLVSDEAFVCPGSTLVSAAHFKVPRRADLEVASGETLTRLQRILSGSYGFPLGYLDQGQWRPVRLLGRANYAVMADSPSLELAGHQTSNHGALIQNVLFEDGHVQQMRSCRDCPNGDDVFHNENGQLAPGNHRDDAVIAPSHWPFLRRVSQ
jgi:hypothetical protein